MCGRYQFSLDNTPALREIVSMLKTQNGLADWVSGDIFPSEQAPVLLMESGRLHPELLAWGFPGPSGKNLIINARAETAATKPMFRDCISHRRCIIPSSGFYEWDGSKRKYLFRLSKNESLWMAGLYDTFAGQKRFCILTTAPNLSMRGIHDRMPLILSKEDAGIWLKDEAAARKLLHATPPELEREDMESQTKLW